MRPWPPAVRIPRNFKIFLARDLMPSGISERASVVLEYSRPPRPHPGVDHVVIPRHDTGERVRERERDVRRGDGFVDGLRFFFGTQRFFMLERCFRRSTGKGQC
jgi:hypothetical protein